MINPLRATFALLLAFGSGCSSQSEDGADRDVSRAPAVVIAHRGASAYAPEHTLAAYELGIEQGADYIEPDLQITSDGVLIALHDETLERTTNVREVFPERFREQRVRGELARVWPAVDFTLEEIKRLDAGSWFGEAFVGAQIPTLPEVIAVARGRAGIFPETKAPEVYGARGFDMEVLLLAQLERHGLDQPGADPDTPVVIQSFSAESLRILRHDLGSRLPLTFLLGNRGSDEWLTPEGLDRIRDFATGIGPARDLLRETPGLVDLAHELGLTVIPYTFRASSPGEGFDTVDEEMSYFLFELGVDALFTDNPDLFPRTEARDGS